MLMFNSEEEVSSALFPRGNPWVPLRGEHRGKLQSFLVDDDHGNVHRLGVHGAHVHQCAAKPLAAASAIGWGWCFARASRKGKRGLVG